MGLDQVSANFPGKALSMRYVPKLSTTYKTTTDSSDIIASSYQKGNDFTVLIDADNSDTSRSLSIDVDGAIPDGTIVERHMLEYGNIDENGYEWHDLTVPYVKVDDSGNLSGGANAIIPVTDKYITVKNGEIVDDVIPDTHRVFVYTTIKQQVQIQLDKPEAVIRTGDSVTFNVEKIYGTNGNINDVTWEIIGKCPVDAILNNGGYGWSTANVGVLNTTAGKTATYTASGVETGDCIAIKVTPNADTSAYKVIVVAIGHLLTLKGAEDCGITSMGIKILESTDFSSISGIINLPVPEKAGSTFVGWTLEQDGNGTAYTKQQQDWNEDMTLYAKWATN